MRKPPDRCSERWIPRILGLVATSVCAGAAGPCPGFARTPRPERAGDFAAFACQFRQGRCAAIPAASASNCSLPADLSGWMFGCYRAGTHTHIPCLSCLSLHNLFSSFESAQSSDRYVLGAFRIFRQIRVGCIRILGVHSLVLLQAVSGGSSTQSSGIRL